ncbi:uncharacterized protein LOC144147306 isoform X2 [Haemaphysalis longicornis]
MSGKPRKRSLFTREDGGPMCFSMMPCQERKEIRELVEYGGGLLVQPDRRADAIRLVPSFITTAYDGSDDVFSSNYIRACSESNKLYPLKDFKVPTSQIALDDSKRRTLRSVRSRREYTLGEDMAIAKFIAERPGVRVRGNAVYQEMAAAGVVSGDHSWQSLKQRYLKTIQPMRHQYESPDAASSLAKRFAEESGAARGSSPRDTSGKHILVEDSDSSSDDNFSPKRRRPAPRELESSENSSTEAEVIAETESQTTPPPEQPETPASQETKAEKRKRPNCNSSTISLVASSDEEASTTKGSPRKVLETKAGRKSTKRQQDSGEVPTGKLRVQASLWQAQGRTPNRSPDSGAARPADRETVVVPSFPPSDKQKTLPTTPKTSSKGAPTAKAHSQSVEIDSDSELEVSPGINKSTTKGTGHNLEAHSSDRSRKQRRRQRPSGRPERTPSPGNTRQPMWSSPRKRGKARFLENSIGQSNTQMHPKSRITDDSACETDSEDPPGPVCIAEGSNLPSAPLLGGRKKKGVASPGKRYEMQTLSSEEEQTMPPKGDRNSSRLRLRTKPTSSAKGSDGVPNVDSSVTSKPNSGSAAERRLPLSPLKERQRGTLPADRGGHSSNLGRLESGHSSIKPPEGDSEDPTRRAHTSEGSKVQTRSLSKSPTNRGVRSHYWQSNKTEQASTEEREVDTPTGTETLSLVRTQNEPPSSAKGTGKKPDAGSSTMSAVNSTRSPERVSSREGKLRSLRLSARKQVGTSPTKSDSGLSIEHRHKSSCNDSAASETDSEDPLGLGRVVRGSLLRAQLPRDQSKTKGVSSRRRGLGKQTAYLEERESSTRSKASALCKQTRLTRSAGERGVESAATRRAADSPMSLDSADENLLARVTGLHSDNASTVTLSSEPSRASPIVIPSSSECSEEDVAAEPDRDSFAAERQRLAKFLGVLKEGNKVPPHASVTCPLDCRCPRSTEYIRAARAAAALGASLAYYGCPLPSDCPGAKDPRVAILLEVLLRRLEGGDADEELS